MKKKTKYILSAFLILMLGITGYYLWNKLDRQDSSDWSASAVEQRPWATVFYDREMKDIENDSTVIKFPKGNPSVSVHIREDKKSRTTYVDLENLETYDESVFPVKIHKIAPDKMVSSLIVSRFYRGAEKDELRHSMWKKSKIESFPKKIQGAFHNGSKLWVNGSKRFKDGNGESLHYATIPKLFIKYDSSIIDERIVNTRLFDAKTKVNLIEREYDNKNIPTGHTRPYTTLKIYLYHPTPVQLVLDTKSKEENSVSLDDQEVKVCGKSEVKLIHQGYYFERRGGGSLQFAKYNEGEIKRIFYFVEWADFKSMAYSKFIVLTKDGKELVSYPISKQGQVAVYEIMTTPENVKQLKLACPKWLNRFVCEFNELPGMLEENRGVENLFDVRIPFLGKRNSKTLLRNLSQITQTKLKVNNFSSEMTDHFVNKTPREILMELTSKDPDFFYEMDKKKGFGEFFNERKTYGDKIMLWRKNLWREAAPDPQKRY